MVPQDMAEEGTAGLPWGWECLCAEGRSAGRVGCCQRSVPAGITSSGATTVLSPGLGVPAFSPLYPVLSLSAMWLRELPLLQPCPAPHTAAGSQSAPSWGVSRFPLLPQGKRSQLPFSSSLSGLPHKVRLAREEEGL